MFRAILRSIRDVLCNYFILALFSIPYGLGWVSIAYSLGVASSTYLSAIFFCTTIIMGFCVLGVIKIRDNIRLLSKLYDRMNQDEA